MNEVYRPSLWRGMPIVLFGFVGLIPLLFGAPGVVRIAGLVTAAIAILFSVVLVTTLFRFGDGIVEVVSIGRRRRFAAGLMKADFSTYPSGFFGTNDAVTLSSKTGRISVSLAIFGPVDRATIRERLSALNRSEPE